LTSARRNSVRGQERASNWAPPATSGRCSSAWRRRRSTPARTTVARRSTCSRCRAGSLDGSAWPAAERQQACASAKSTPPKSPSSTLRRQRHKSPAP